MLSRAPPSSVSIGLDDDDLGVSCARDSDDMRNCWRIEILRLRTAALIRIFTRTFGFLCHWGVSQRALLEELSCEVFPLGVLQVCPTEFPASFSLSLRVLALTLELVSLSLSCTLPTRSQSDVHQRPWSSQHSADEPRVCTTMSDSISHLSTW